MITGTSGRAAFAFGKSSRPLMPGMLMSERIRISEAPAASWMHCSRAARRLCEIHGEAAGAEVAPELLAEQHLDIGFVVDDENQKTHLVAPVLLTAAARGSTTLNSVNSPGSVSTSIDPACCFTTIS